MKAMPDLAAELRDQWLMDQFVKGLIDQAPSVAGELDLHAEMSCQEAVIRARKLMLLERINTESGQMIKFKQLQIIQVLMRVWLNGSTRLSKRRSW